METNILMESGTNEVEILEFLIGNNHYGINVAKIKEIVPYAEITPVPVAKPEVEGIFMPRDEMITVIDLARVLKMPASGNVNTDMFIITNFNKLNVAFHVHQVMGIHRVSWADIITPDSTVSSEEHGIATGIIKYDTNLIIVLDFERIVSEISPETGLKVSEVEKYASRSRNESPILIAEDSPLLIRLISDSLHKAGYTNLTLCKNGQEAWDSLRHYKSVGDVDRYVSCVITDLEMPLMDGHRLTKLIKTDDELSHIPVIIFSSLINDQMRVKGESLGADAQLSKPEIGHLVNAIDKLLQPQEAIEED
jgi:two-component system chemotaxis response regulator CheV